METYDELQAEIAKLQEKANRIRQKEKEAAIATIRELMTKFEISPAELGGVLKNGSKNSPPTAKYRDPASNQVWSGRGKPPKWMQAYLSANRTKDEFLINL